MQKQNDAIIVDGSTFSVPEEGGDVSIKVQSNVKYDVEIPSDASWLKKSTKASTRGLETSTILLAPQFQSIALGLQIEIPAKTFIQKRERILQAIIQSTNIRMKSTGTIG